MRHFLTITFVAVTLTGLSTAIHAQDMMHATPAASVEWAPIQPPGFDPGMEIAVIHGNPDAADQPYTLRLRLPDGYRFPAHYHPRAENVTVLSGTFLLAMGARPADSPTAYAPGSYLYIPPEKPHYGGARGATVIQLHGVGPFEILLAEPGSTGDR